MKRKPSQMRRASTKIEAWRAQDESKSRYQPATSSGIFLVRVVTTSGIYDLNGVVFASPTKDASMQLG